MHPLAMLLQVGGEVVEALAAYGPSQLQELDVSWCREVSGEALGHLADACPNLARIEAWGCTQLEAAFWDGHSNDGLRLLGRGEALLPVPGV